MDKLKRVREMIRVEFNAAISDGVAVLAEVVETPIGSRRWEQDHEYLVAREKVKLLKRLDEKVLEMIDTEPGAPPIPLEAGREYWHGLLDQAFDQTNHGHSFLPEFVALVIDTLREKR